MRKRGQLWVETVIYLLIGLSLISLTLAFVLPKVNSQRERLIIEQTIVALNDLHGTMQEVARQGEGNRRVIDFSLRVGEFVIDGENDKISFILEDLHKPYSQPGISIPAGNVIVKTELVQKSSRVRLELPLDEFDLQFEGTQAQKEISPASVPYRFSIEHKGIGQDAQGLNRTVVDVSLIS